MSINRVNTTDEAKTFTFLDNQSSILHNADTNKITVNGVNVIVDKPKRGDVMCITRYTDGGGELLGSDKQKVVWIDGLSINPKQLLQELEPVGICMVVNGNKALVRYKEERNLKWAAADRWELGYLNIMTDGSFNQWSVYLNDKKASKRFSFQTTTKKDFVDQLNDFLWKENTDFSAELAMLYTDYPGPTDDDLLNRIVVNARFTKDDWNKFEIKELNFQPTRAICKFIKAIQKCYRKNGFTSAFPICCKAATYDWTQKYQIVTASEIKTINYVPGGAWGGQCPVNEYDFTENVNCQLLRNTFSSYDEYLNSLMAKYPCGAGGFITEFPSGKENTYKLADCRFKCNDNMGNPKLEILYPAADWAAKIEVNAPKLGRGNWWLPSPAEFMQMMRDITYGTTFWETEPDIINLVLEKLHSVDSNWSVFSATTMRWTSAKSDDNTMHIYGGSLGIITTGNFFSSFQATPITIYEF